MMMKDYEFFESNLTVVFDEIKQQADVGLLFPPDMLSFEGQIEQLAEWLQEAGEYGLVYESLVSLLENFPFNLSGSAVIKLLEIGLVFGYKTESESDKYFDRR